MPKTKYNISKHNSLQRLYYEEALAKPAMQVANSNYVHRHIERMIRAASLTTEAEILEVGAGLGKFSLPMIATGFRPVCLDLSPVMLDRLKRAAPVPVEVLSCDVADVAEYTNRRFDFGVGFFTLHHMHDLDLVFRALSRVVRHKGVVAFCEPNPFYLPYYAQIALTPGMHWRAEKGLLGMRDGKVHAAMRRSGIEPRPTMRYGFLPPALVNRASGARFEDYLHRLLPALAPRAFQIFRGTVHHDTA